MKKIPTNSKEKPVKALVALSALVIGVVFAPVAHSAPPPPCTYPDGTPCAEPPGCIDPATSLPCSSSLPDINAAIRHELQQILPGLLTR